MHVIAEVIGVIALFETELRHNDHSPFQAFVRPYHVFQSRTSWFVRQRPISRRHRLSPRSTPWAPPTGLCSPSSSMSSIRPFRESIRHLRLEERLVAAPIYSHPALPAAYDFPRMGMPSGRFPWPHYHG